MANTGKDHPFSSFGSWVAGVLDVRCPNCSTRTVRTLYWRCGKCGYPSREKIRCPNCGQTTARTRDWACQWCGYPLTSPLYAELPGDFMRPAAESALQVKREEEALTPVAEKPLETPPPAALSEPSLPELLPAPVPAVEASLPVPEPVASEPPPPPAETSTPAEIQMTAEENPPPPLPVEPVQEPESVPVPPISDEVMITTVEDLCGDFLIDSILADRKYAGHMLRLKGTMEQVSSGEIGSSPLVTLTSTDVAAQKKVVCSFGERYRPVITRMTPGQKVAVFGRYDGCEQDIRLADCMPVG